MNIGIPKEVKNKENRVAVTPATARMLVQAGHEVRVQCGAGVGSGCGLDMKADNHIV